MLAALWLTYWLPAPFHEDEAIYAAWALRILRGDWWLAATPVDKPPLTFYPLALSLALFGRHEWAARLPALLWTALLLAVLWRLAAQRERPGWLAVGLALLAPLLWAQATSAFTDPAMVALALLATERAQSGRPRQAGLAFALALLAKPTALLLAPLALFFTLHAEAKIENRKSKIKNFVLALAAPLLLAWAWDASRAAPSWWALGAQAYGTLGNPNAQLVAWVRVAWQSLGGLAVMGALASWAGVRRVSSLPLALTALLWIPLHGLLGFQPWERYLLPLVPLLALWASSVVAWERHPRLLAALAVLALVLGGGQRLAPHDESWQGIAEVGAAVEALPPGATVAYRALGRPLAWYAADARATLVWAGEKWALLPTDAAPLYAALRATEPAPPGVWAVVAESGHFRLLVVHR